MYAEGSASHAAYKEAMKEHNNAPVAKAKSVASSGTKSRTSSSTSDSDCCAQDRSVRRTQREILHEDPDSAKSSDNFMGCDEPLNSAFRGQ